MSVGPYDTCPICSMTGSAFHLPEDVGMAHYTRYNCPNCGHFRMSSSAAMALNGPLFTESDRCAIAHVVRKLPPGTLLTSMNVNKLRGRTTLPPALERVDNVLLHVARAVAPGAALDLTARTMMATLGTESEAGALWAMRQARAMGFVDGEDVRIGASRMLRVSMTATGWQRHEHLMREGAGSRHAFMAMRFGDKQMDDIYRVHMRPAVDQAGFELRTTNEDHATAGSIDNRMRVEIRTSRFVVCDLTHGNRGAYWEAGFAEGLGRPVFYTCRADVLADKTHPDHPHFDTAHQLIVGWDPQDAAPGMNELKNVIRATLPAEARLED